MQPQLRSIVPSQHGRVLSASPMRCKLTELDPESTITSIDGICAFDTMSRKAMLEGLAQVPGGSAVLPFVRVSNVLFVSIGILVGR